MAVNMKLVSEFQTIHRRSFELAVPTILDPTNVRPLVEGEFLQLDTAYKMARGGDNAGNLTDEALVPSFCYFAEQGRYETQAIGKGPMLYLGGYEADTKIMDATGLGIGDALTVYDLDLGGIIRRGLGQQTLATAFVIGYVTRLPGANNGFLRFVRSNP
jgi:hypothetical protein